MASLTQANKTKKRSLSESDIKQGPAKKISFDIPEKKKEEEKVKNQSSRIIIIIDETGSMHTRKNATISGIREFVDSQLTVTIDGEEEPKLTFVFFNITSRTFTWDKLSQVKDTSLENNLDTVLNSYTPDNCTALYDTLHNVTNEFGHEEYNIVAIFTDGEDNSSRIASASSVKDKIKKLQDDSHWQFHFLTVGLDSWTANTIGQSMGLQTQAVDPNLDINTQMTQMMRGVSNNIYMSRNSSVQMQEIHRNGSSTNPQ